MFPSRPLSANRSPIFTSGCGTGPLRRTTSWRFSPACSIGRRRGSWCRRGPIRRRSFPKYKARKHERFLTEEEFRRLGRVLAEAADEGGASKYAVAALRLLMLTGCRRSEILRLRWSDVDLEAKVLHLADSKTGPRAVPLSPAAARLLSDLPRVADNPWVIVGRKRGTHLHNLNQSWDIIRRRAGLEDVRLHGPASFLGQQSACARRRACR